MPRTAVADRSTTISCPRCGQSIRVHVADPADLPRAASGILAAHQADPEQCAS